MSTKIGVRWQGYLLALIVAICGAASAVAAADTVVKKEIVIGQTMPYTGPASSYSVIGRAEIAYFNKVNAEGGVNGRKIRLISLDDAYSRSEERREGKECVSTFKSRCAPYN